MLNQVKGRFCIIGSVCSYCVPPGTTAYSMSKFAVRAFALGLQQEATKNDLTTTLILPGYVKSEIVKIDKFGNYHENQSGRAPKWLVMETEAAAKQIFKAVHKRKKEKILTNHGKIAIWLQRHFPNVLYWAFNKM